MNSLLSISGSPAAVKTAADAICQVLKVAGTEATSVAAMHTLAELARAPSNMSITGCSFTNAPPTAKKRKR